jgi:hypothetical protein
LASEKDPSFPDAWGFIHRELWKHKAKIRFSHGIRPGAIVPEHSFVSDCRPWQEKLKSADIKQGGYQSTPAPDSAVKLLIIIN